MAIDPPPPCRIGATDPTLTGWTHAEPLWKRAPKRDENGHPYCDFMMLAPGLKHRPPEEIARIVEDVRLVLTRFESLVVFADVNLKLNILWVSLHARPGAFSQIVAALRLRIPLFKLVSHHPEHWR